MHAAMWLGSGMGGNSFRTFQKKICVISMCLQYIAECVRGSLCYSMQYFHCVVDETMGHIFMATQQPAQVVHCASAR